MIPVSVGDCNTGLVGCLLMVGELEGVDAGCTSVVGGAWGDGAGDREGDRAGDRIRSEPEWDRARSLGRPVSNVSREVARIGVRGR